MGEEILSAHRTFHPSMTQNPVSGASGRMRPAALLSYQREIRKINRGYDDDDAVSGSSPRSGPPAASPAAKA